MAKTERRFHYWWLIPTLASLITFIWCLLLFSYSPSLLQIMQKVNPAYRQVGFIQNKINTCFQQAWACTLVGISEDNEQRQKTFLKTPFDNYGKICLDPENLFSISIKDLGVK